MNKTQQSLALYKILDEAFQELILNLSSVGSLPKGWEVGGEEGLGQGRGAL